MSEQCERVQQDVRVLLGRLRPLGADGEPQAGGCESSARLHELLLEMASGAAQ